MQKLWISAIYMSLSLSWKYGRHFEANWFFDQNTILRPWGAGGGQALFGQLLSFLVCYSCLSSSQRYISCMWRYISIVQFKRYFGSKKGSHGGWRFFFLLFYVAKMAKIRLKIAIKRLKMVQMTWNFNTPCIMMFFLKKMDKICQKNSDFLPQNHEFFQIWQLDLRFAYFHGKCIKS